MQATERSVRVAIWGAGWVAGGHLKAFLANPHAEVVAVGSRREESCRQLLAPHGLDLPAYTDYNRLLDDPNVDAIVLCTPNHLHADETIRAARAGKHLLIEKPVALNLDELRAAQEAVRAAGIITVAGFVVRWTPLILSLKQLREQGDFGEIFLANAAYWSNRSGRPAFQKARATAISPWLVGGCHAVDAIRYVTGLEVTEVAGYAAPAGPAYGYDYECVQAAAVQWSNGATGTFTTAIVGQTPYQFDLDILGSKGTARNKKLYLDRLPGEEAFFELPVQGQDSSDVVHHTFGGEIDHFVTCVQTGQRSHIDLDDAARTHEIAFAIEQSIRERRSVCLPLS
ncbi:MAG: Gfo/Idh/MocA family oxidoreductase [Chloroflexi bacterium]|nr:Gfo/Idh/MocA family oxidoreductase [Chloroflexota bacterium]